MNKRHYEHTLPNIRGSLSNTYFLSFHVESSKAGMIASFLQRQLVFFADSLLSRLNDRFLSIIPSGLLSCFLERLQS